MLTVDHILNEIELLVKEEIKDLKKGLYFSSELLQKERHRLQKLVSRIITSTEEKITEEYSSI